MIQDVVLVGDLGVHHKTATTLPSDPRKGQWPILCPAGIEFSLENEACLGLTQQDAPTDRLIVCVLLDVKAVLCQNLALTSAELLA